MQDKRTPLSHIQSFHPPAQLQCPKITETIPPSYEHGRVAAQAGHGGVGGADPVHYVKQGYPVSNSTGLKVFSHEYLLLLKKFLPPKRRYFQRFEPLRYRSCIVRINQTVVVVQSGLFYGNGPGRPLHFDSCWDVWGQGCGQ